MGQIEDKANLLKMVIEEFRSVHSFSPIHGEYENNYDLAFIGGGPENFQNYPGLLHILDKDNKNTSLMRPPQRYNSGGTLYLLVGIKEFVKEKPPAPKVKYVAREYVDWKDYANANIYATNTTTSSTGPAWYR